ncbi:hypothetical protein HCJ92_10430 [Streptomyces sp. ventii]|uniref:Uncharacterized protein n=1 Tax=Streptomyces spiramenti TaxID=2720606 RepID=A0ABX1AQF8_9ACTN|nr:hypothetical protein [Streptomyces spiramenti]
MPSQGLLPYGATGFARPDDGALPEVAHREFRAALHHAARTARGRVAASEPRAYPQTFHRAVLTDRLGAAHTVLGHCHLRWVAFVDGSHDLHRDDFLTPPPWAAAFRHAGFEVLGRETLRLDLDHAGWDALTPVERREARYHGTRTLGGAVFNQWD